ncbi:copper resistance protein CopZ [Streptococcus azizii]|uniref:Copper resistance protein CopZ n=1 Tax=Streptococcus azizii TaxID=1579424 RepID=A0AB36JRX7_9STRE|nr:MULTISPECIES: heavy metal-associated domain-containing protein [Streptococcus]MBF0776594.1 heavy-metal-associated domain-containing protein [Streptococcus sp. 19428wD3_AN2]ONK26161.1 copper resistance protein CopZ [Streptococcus azizii]ONK26660.1 copper resistance protein CopZ [Streptococcus azizii]ONK27571.1 copper resistance protein CopZ [Streptococcus azizii]TFU82691.1 heavy-metal-associated domain-containing protein [Streptococcus sp. AN2]
MQTIKLSNLSCQNCIKHVTERFKTMPGVVDVTIDLDRQVASVKTSVNYSLEDYQASLSDTVYEAVETL